MPFKAPIPPLRMVSTKQASGFSVSGCCWPFAIESLQSRRTAGGAACRLSVEAAGSGVLIFCATFCAHGKGRHRRLRPVIRPCARWHNRQSRAAIGAIQEWIAVAAVGGIEQFPEALLANGHVRRNEYFTRNVGLAGLDAKARASPLMACAPLKRCDECGRGGGGRSDTVPSRNGSDRALPYRLRLRSKRCRSGSSQSRGDSDERPSHERRGLKADALDNAFDDNRPRRFHVGGTPSGT